MYVESRGEGNAAKLWSQITGNLDKQKQFSGFQQIFASTMESFTELCFLQGRIYSDFYASDSKFYIRVFIYKLLLEHFNSSVIVLKLKRGLISCGYAFGSIH